MAASLLGVRWPERKKKDSCARFTALLLDSLHGEEEVDEAETSAHFDLLWVV